MVITISLLLLLLLLLLNWDFYISKDYVIVSVEILVLHGVYYIIYYIYSLLLLLVYYDWILLVDIG